MVNLNQIDSNITNFRQKEQPAKVQGILKPIHFAEDAEKEAFINKKKHVQHVVILVKK